MQTRQVVALVTVIVVIALALGVTIGYTISSQKTSTVTDTATMTSISISTVTQNTSSTFYASAKCTIAGQPGGLLLGIESDSTLRPIVGANVAATNTPALCNGVPATNETTMKFTTNGTVWYPLRTDNDASYSFVVTF